jgi:hypothetical protein
MANALPSFRLPIILIRGVAGNRWSVVEKVVSTIPYGYTHSVVFDLLFRGLAEASGLRFGIDAEPLRLVRKGCLFGPPIECRVGRSALE